MLTNWRDQFSWIENQMWEFFPSKKKGCMFLKNQFQMPLLRMLKKKLGMNIKRHVDDDEQVACVMLASMSPKFKGNMRIWMPILWLCISKNYLMRQVGLRGMRPLRNCSAVRWQRVLQWTPMFWKWLAILRNWAN